LRIYIHNRNANINHRLLTFSPGEGGSVFFKNIACLGRALQVDGVLDIGKQKHSTGKYPINMTANNARKKAIIHAAMQRRRTPLDLCFKGRYLSISKPAVIEPAM